MIAGDQRLADLAAWLDGFEFCSGAELVPASADASFRRYFRARARDTSLIAVDAPPARENSRPFVQVAQYLEAMGMNSPRVIEADLERGFLLLTDLGNTHYLEQITANRSAAGTLYDDALAALLNMQVRGKQYQAQLPPFDAVLLQAELSLFSDWLCERHLDIHFSDDDARAWRALCDLLINNALEQPQVFVHADYHSRNLMVTDTQNPGILDFQDAMEGPLTYDLVSLLKDCYIRLPAGEVRDRARSYYAALSDDIQAQLDSDGFLRSFELMGVQRHLKAAGIFARLNRRDGKPRYMEDVPRTLSYIVELAPRYQELEFLLELLASRVLPALLQRPG